MKKSINDAIIQNPTARAVILIVLVHQLLSGHEPSPARNPRLHRGVRSLAGRCDRGRAVSLELEMVLARAPDMRGFDHADSDVRAGLRMTRRATRQQVCSRARLLNQLGAKSRELLIGDGS